MADFRVTEISVTTGAGSLAVADVTCYAEPANTGSLAVVEVSCTATPASTVASFVYTGREWVRGVPHVWTDGAQPVLTATFESTTDGFTAVSGLPSVAQDTTRAHTGTGALKVTHSAASGAQFSGRSVAVAPSTDYRITAWSWQPSTNYYWLQILGSGIVGGGRNSTAKDDSGAWVEHTIDFTTTSSASSITLNLSASTVAGGIVWWDDVSVREVTDSTAGWVQV